MARTSLSWTDPSHQALLCTWTTAVEARADLDDWKKQNPIPDFGTDELSAWSAAHHAKQQELGLCGPYNQLQWDQRLGVWSIKIGEKGQGEFGHYLRQCPECGNVFATDDAGHKFCSDACEATYGSARLEAKRERRKKRDAEITAALANRKGICMACGTEFDLKRTTAKTCSETCRKRLQRTPELLAEHLQPIPVRDDLEQLRSNAGKARQTALDLTLKQTPLTEQESAQLKALEDYSAEIEPVLEAQRRAELLNVIAGHAPALAAWLMKQPDDVQAEALNREGRRTILGTALTKKLGIPSWEP